MAESMTTQAPTRTPIAVFDYDGTSIDGQSGLLLSRYLNSHGIITKRTGVLLAWWGVRYVFHLPHRQGESRELIFRDLGAFDHAEVEKIMREFHDEVLVPRYRPEAFEEIERRHEEGCVTLLVSATFSDLANVAGAYLGVDGVVATQMELTPDGRFTGRVAGKVIEGDEKPLAVERWANEHLGEGTWEIAYAYGDHHSDEELLSEAGTAYAVCPGETLKRLAKRYDWEILDWDEN